MSLARKLARLEVLVRAQQPAAPTYWTPERQERWAEWMTRLVATMPPERAERVHIEVTTLSIDEYGPVTIAVHATASWRAGSTVEHDRPLAFPEEVCAMLEAHPGLHPRSSRDCEDCGFETPGGSDVAWCWYRDAAYRSGRARHWWPDVRGHAPMTTCPLCGGRVSSQEFNAKLWQALWERQKAELAAGAVLADSTGHGGQPGNRSNRQ